MNVWHVNDTNIDEIPCVGEATGARMDSFQPGQRFKTLCFNRGFSHRVRAQLFISDLSVSYQPGFVPFAFVIFGCTLRRVPPIWIAALQTRCRLPCNKMTDMPVEGAR